jgi:two-component system chemotaxis response regulator CheB
VTVENDDDRVSVLLVDDSAVVRELVQRLFQRDPSLTVTTAADPLIALTKMKRSRPDVILLDLAMPRMDGISFLRKLMAEDPIPVVVFSAATGSTEAAVRALAEGAVDVVTKPTVGVRDFLEDSYTMLVDVVRGAKGARVRRRSPAAPPAVAPAEWTRGPGSEVRAQRMIALGASTGGTEALELLLRALPPDAPPVVIVQHMPQGFTAAFATRLDRACRVEVSEARSGDALEPGRVLIAPGNRHMQVCRAGARLAVEVSDAAPVSRHRPSVDVLFHSVAASAGAAAVGAILTGMGADGAAGLLAMRRRGAATLAQDEASCVVFGMPGAAIAAGAVDEVVPLNRMAIALMRRACAHDAAEHRNRRDSV